MLCRGRVISPTGIARCSRPGKLPERYEGWGVVDLYRDYGIGGMEQVLANPWRQTYDTDEIAVKSWEEEREGKRLIHVEWTTPVGSLHQVQQFEPLGYTWAYLEYPCKTSADLRTLQFLCHHTQFEADYSHQLLQIEKWGGEGIPGTIPPRMPMADLLVIWMGVTNTVYALLDDREEVHRTLDALDERDERLYPIVCDSPAPLVCFGENISAEVVGPKVFRDYYLPYHIKRSAQVRKAGKHTLVHIDGTMRGVLEQVAASGIQCAQSLTPAPVGDLTPRQMRELAGPEVLLWTGVPGALFSPLYPAQTVERCVREILEELMEEGKVLIGTCDQVPPDGDMERVRLVSELVEKYGRY